MIALLAGYAVYGNIQINKIPSLSFDEAFEYTLKDNENAVITVGVIQDGVSSYTVYGENGVKLSATEHIYEVGSITKTFTAALARKKLS